MDPRVENRTTSNDNITCRTTVLPIIPQVEAAPVVPLPQCTAADGAEPNVTKLALPNAGSSPSIDVSAAGGSSTTDPTRLGSCKTLVFDVHCNRLIDVQHALAVLRAKGCNLKGYLPELNCIQQGDQAFVKDGAVAFLTPGGRYKQSLPTEASAQRTTS